MAELNVCMMDSWVRLGTFWEAKWDSGNLKRWGEKKEKEQG